MARPRDSELRLRGLGLRARFALSMTIALMGVMGVTAWLIHAGSTRINEQDRSDAIARAVARWVSSRLRPLVNTIAPCSRKSSETLMAWSSKPPGLLRRSMM